MNPRYVGDKVSVMAVLHTWTRAMIYHPHLHCIVPGGGIDPEDGSRREARYDNLVPVRTLSKLFRTRFMQLARKRHPHLIFPQSVWDHNWVVYANKAFKGPEKVLDYLGRYVHRVAITNTRIFDWDDSQVRFRYLDRKRHQLKIAKLSTEEFMRRFLQHVLLRGFHTVCSYGLLSPPWKPRLRQLQLLLPPKQIPPRPAVEANPMEKKPGFGSCPACGQAPLVSVSWLPPRPTPRMAEP